MTPEFFDSGVARSQSDVLGKLFEHASAQLRSIVLRPPGGTQSSREFRQAWAASQVNQIDRIIRDLGGHTSKWIGKNVPQAYADGKRRADKQAREAGVKIAGPMLEGSFSLVDQRTVRVFAHDIAADLGKASDSMRERAKHVLRATAQEGMSERDISTILAGGIIEGRPRDTIRTLREELTKIHGDTVQVIDKNGDPINFKAGYYAEMVARTKTREATVVARHERLQELDLDLVAIVGRVSKNFCTAFLGQVFSLSGKSEKYPAYSSLPGGGPPFHPNCSKSTRPFIEELASDRQLDQADGLGDANALLGMDTSKAQRAFQDLQLFSQQKDRYANTEKQLFKGGSKAA